MSLVKKVERQSWSLDTDGIHLPRGRVEVVQLHLVRPDIPVLASNWSTPP